MHLHPKRMVLLAVVVAVMPTLCSAQTLIAEQGKAMLKVVVGESASLRTRQAADDLASYLSRIADTRFDVVVGDGSTGLAVGAAADFPELDVQIESRGKTLTASESYLLKSHGKGVYLIGATDLGAQHAVWDLLHRMGYRHFFPGENWEIVPHQPRLAIEVDTHQAPSFRKRLIWYGFGPWGYNDEPYALWVRHNRGESDFDLKTGHSWNAIYKNNAEAFEANPRFYAEIEGVRAYRGGTTKICIANAQLRELVVADRIAEMKRYPDRESVSIDPTDGGGWCECKDCAALGSVTDQLVTLANEVAEAIVQEFGPDRYVGMYAYNKHSPPPSIDVHPNVIVSIATRFIRSGYDVETLIAEWSERASTLGIREYYSVFAWDRDLPGRPEASHLSQLAANLQAYHQANARFMNAEASDNWGAAGPGYYAAQRMLWDIDEARDVNWITDDFLARSFGAAEPPMRKFYELTHPPGQALLSDDLIGRMYRLLAEARDATQDPHVQKRIADLILYTRYVELYFDYANASGPNRQRAFEQVVRHSYRMRRSMMVHAKAVFRDLIVRDKSVEIPEGAEWHVSEADNPWKASAPFEREELDGLVASGIKNHPLLDFQPVAFSRDLVPADDLIQADRAAKGSDLLGRATRAYFTWFPVSGGTIELEVTGGLIVPFNKGDVKLYLYPISEVEGKAVDQANIPPDAKPHQVRLTSTHEGLHRLEVSDGGDMSRVVVKSDHRLTYELSPESVPYHIGRQNFFFYVPQGTQVIGGYSKRGQGSLYSPSGELVIKLENPGHFSVPVDAADQGKLWSVRQTLGELRFMTVPPYVSQFPEGLLLPQELMAPR